MVTLSARPARRPRRLGAILVAASTSMALLLTPAGAQAQISDDADRPHQDNQDRAHLAALDIRLGAATAPTAAAQAEVEQLGATVRWTPFGTPQSLIRHGDFLATDLPGDSPSAAARAWLDQHRSLYQLDSASDLVVHAQIPLGDDAYVVVLRQLVGGLAIAPDGMATIGLVGSAEQGWSVAYAGSTLVGQDSLTVSPRLAGAARLSMRNAVVEAAADAGADVADSTVTTTGTQAGWRVLDIEGIEAEQYVRQVAFPVPGAGIRTAYETVYYDGAEEGYRYFVDAATGEVLFRESIVAAHSADNPSWDVFPSLPQTAAPKPPWNFPSADTRQVWCWTDAPRCRMAVANDAARVAWDVDARTGEPTFTTIGNAVDAAEWWLGAAGGPGQRPTSDSRTYHFPWTNVWHTSRCHSDNFVPGGNDIDASVTNLFVQNWRMHDWSYRLGFTEETWNAQDFNFGVNTAGENDPVIARAQSGALAGSLNNATMATRPDGLPSIMSMFIWMPQANAFYGPCVIGDYDLGVIGHEYTHMIENRLIGKGAGRSGFHAGAMGESWGDLVGMEYQNEYGFVRGNEFARVATGAYATGNQTRGIRNYNMAFPSAGQFPQQGREVPVGTLHFGAMGYDITGPQVHADSQIWSATNYDIRRLLLERYPGSSPQVQQQCADGERPLHQCPGNRRWIQLVFDAMLLMPTAPTMLDARDAYFAADLMRFGGANQDLLWQGFARRGFGVNASVGGVGDTDPVPSFESPLHESATLRFEFRAKDEGGQPIDAEVYVGNYEARTTPIGQVERFIPDPDGYNFVARADGYGHVRFFIKKLQPGEDRTVTIHFPTNVASLSQGATATGDGIRHSDLIDDTEATNWQSVFESPNVVTIDAPSAAAGSYGATGAAFGPAPTVAGFAGDIVLVNDGSALPAEGCGPLIGFPAGAIALVDRGTCPFTEKVANAQAAGAVAVIVANNVPGAPIEMAGADPTIVIPSVMVSQADGDTIKAGLPATGSVAATLSSPVGGTSVVIALDGPQTIREAKASAMLLPGQNRFTALRQFELYSCVAGNTANPTCDGSVNAGWKRILRSNKDAFPAPNPRPSSPDLVLRSFNVSNTTATHVKFVVMHNQCTGNPNYQGQQHSDPAAPDPDCRSTTVGANEVRAAEVQLLTSRAQVDGATLVD